MNEPSSSSNIATKDQTQELVMGQVALPRDIFYSMFSHFTPKMISSLALTNSQFKWILEDQDFWKTKFKIHFSKYFDQTAALNPASWHAEYIERENQEYKDLTSEERYLITVLKERDMDEVIDYDYDYDYDYVNGIQSTMLILPFDNYPRPNHLSYIYLANKYKRQKFLDYYYFICENRYAWQITTTDATTASTITNTVATIEDYTSLHEAVLSCQPDKTLAALTTQDPSLFANKDNPNGDTPLNVAAWVGNIEAAKWLIKHQPPGINHRDQYGAGPWESAILGGQLEFVKYLMTTRFYDSQRYLHYASMALEEGYSDIALFFIGENYKNAIKYKQYNYRGFGKIPFFLAAAHTGCWDIVKLLMQKSLKETMKIIFVGHQYQYNNTVLFYTSIANAGRVELLELLTQNKATTKKVVRSISAEVMYEVLLCLNNNSHPKFLEKFTHIILENAKELKIDTKSNNYLKLLRMLFENRHFELFKIAFKKNPEKALGYVYDDSTFFWEAAIGNNVDLVNFFLTHGAKNEKIEKNYFTPLSIAVKDGHLAVVEAMISAKVDVNQASTSVDHSLYLAIKYQDIRFVKLLIKGGAQVNALQDKKGYTVIPVQIAFDKENFEVLQCLLEAGAEATSEDYQQYLFKAAETGNFIFVKYLIEKNVSVRNCNLEEFFLKFSEIETPYLKMSKSEHNIPVVEFKPTQDNLSHTQINNIMQLRLWCQYCYIKYVIQKKSINDKSETPETAVIKDLLYRSNQNQDKPFLQHIEACEKANLELLNSQKVSQWNENKNTTASTSQQTMFNSSKAPDPLDLNAFLNQLKEDIEIYAKHSANRADRDNVNSLSYDNLTM